MAWKYARFHSFLLAYLWNIDRPQELVSYLLTYPEAFKIAKTMGWTATASWETALYRMAPPSRRLLDLLERHRMGRGRWRAKILQPLR